MKRIILIFTFFILVATVSGCRKFPSPAGDREIVFNLNGGGLIFDVRTKADEITASNLSQVYWEIKQGTDLVGKSGSTPFSVDSAGRVTTGLYWPANSAAIYSFYVSNVEVADRVITADNSTDIVCGSANGTPNKYSGIAVDVSLEHIFARTDSLRLTAAGGYEVSDVKWEIESINKTVPGAGAGTGTAGTYSIDGGYWISSGITPLARREFDSSSNLYLIPGNYTVYVTYTLSKGAYVDTFAKQATVTFAAGKKNSIMATVPAGNAHEVIFSVSVAEWSTQTLFINQKDFI